MEATKRPWEFIEHTKHTNMPARMQGYSFGIKGKGTDGGVIYTYNPGNIEIIETAVNSYDALVEACKMARHRHWLNRKHFNNSDHTFMNVLSEALKLAEGGE